MCFKTVKWKRLKIHAWRKLSNIWGMAAWESYQISSNVQIDNENQRIRNKERMSFSSKRMLNVRKKTCNSKNAATTSFEITTQWTSGNKKDEITSQAIRV